MYLVERSTDAMKHTCKYKEAAGTIYDVKWADYDDKCKLQRKKVNRSVC